jgi:ATP-binding cassette subfamily B protein
MMISQIFNLIKISITFFSTLLVLINLSWWITVIAIIVPLPSFLTNVKFATLSHKLSTEIASSRRQIDYFNALLTTDTYIKEVKIFNLSNFFIEHHSKLVKEIAQKNYKFITKKSTNIFIYGLINILSSCFIYVYVAFLAINRYITIGDMTFYTQLSSSISSNFQSLLNNITFIYENGLFLNNFYEVLGFEPKIVNTANALPLELVHSIEFKNVYFSYPDAEKKPILIDLSFKVSRGEKIALVGFNGTGKTTIIKLLARLYDVEKGQILINGIDIKKYKIEDLRAKIGVLFQDFNNYHLSAQDNIGVGSIENIGDNCKIKRAAKKSGADTVITKLPQGYKTLLGKWFDKGEQLSGGQWQKIALARAFIRDAQLLILDEPTSALDPQAENELFINISKLAYGKTTIFTTHRFNNLLTADRILVLEKGRILEEGTHDELLAQNGQYSSLFNLQAKGYRKEQQE